MAFNRLFFGNYILTVSLFAWCAAQVLKTIINFALSGKFETERLYGAGGMPKAVALELLDAYQNQGNIIKKRDDTHKMAQANKAFAHYAW